MCFPRFCFCFGLLFLFVCLRCAECLCIGGNGPTEREQLLMQEREGLIAGVTSLNKEQGGIRVQATGWPQGGAPAARQSNGGKDQVYA